MYRYALYFAPPRDCALWQAGTQWLGRDPESNSPCAPPALAGYTVAYWERITTSARRYGFHATLKAPFCLAEGRTPPMLRQSLHTFCQAQPSVPLPELCVTTLGDFLALRLVRRSSQLEQLADQCVRSFDEFRAPLGGQERARRLSASLSDRQRMHLDTHGYPFVMDDWRFHLTLTDALPSAERIALLPTVQAYFAASLAAPVQVEDIALFAQPAADSDFVLLERCRLG